MDYYNCHDMSAISVASAAAQQQHTPNLWVGPLRALQPADQGIHKSHFRYGPRRTERKHSLSLQVWNVPVGLSANTNQDSLVRAAEEISKRTNRLRFHPPLPSGAANADRSNTSQLG